MISHQDQSGTVSLEEMRRGYDNVATRADVGFSLDGIFGFKGSGCGL